MSMFLAGVAGCGACVGLAVHDTGITLFLGAMCLFNLVLAYMHKKAREFTSTRRGDDGQ